MFLNLNVKKQKQKRLKYVKFDNINGDPEINWLVGFKAK